MPEDIALYAVILAVGDWPAVQRCRDWYAHHLRLPLARELDGESSWFRAGAIEVGLHTGTATAAPAATLSFDVTDVDAEVDRLRAEGVEISDPTDRAWGARAATTRDPAGFEVILMSRRPS
jgi:catechol 2,3-dioxygenase-like lactoylglutathione lyase family enzyme